MSRSLLVLVSLPVRTVRLEWSRPGRPSGIMLGYEVLRRTLRSCAVGSTGLSSSVGEESGGAGAVKFRCSYLQCPAGHGVCGMSCFPPDIQVIMFWSFDTFFVSHFVLYEVELWNNISSSCLLIIHHMHFALTLTLLHLYSCGQTEQNSQAKTIYIYNIDCSSGGMH